MTKPSNGSRIKNMKNTVLALVAGAIIFSGVGFASASSVSGGVLSLCIRNNGAVVVINDGVRLSKCPRKTTPYELKLWDEGRITALEARVTELEAAVIATPTPTPTPTPVYYDGLNLKLVSLSEYVVVEDSSPDIGTFVIKFKGLAVNMDVFVDDICTNGLGGVDYGYEGTLTPSCSLTTSADESAHGDLEINEATAEEFTLTVAGPGGGDFVQVFLRGVNWSATDGGPYSAYTSNLATFRTDPLYIGN